MRKFYRDLAKRHNHIVKRENQEISFVILLYFLAAFIAARAIVYADTYGFIPDIFVAVKGVHIHHFNYGIFILAITGFLSLVKRDNPARIAKFYAVGLALTFDEFGMWLRLQDDYWTRQSYDAIIIIGAILLNIIYFYGVWKKIIEKNIELAAKFWEKALGKAVLRAGRPRKKKILAKK